MTLKEYRKEVPLNEYIYLQINHQLRFTTLKKNGGKFNNCNIVYIGTLGGKRWIKIQTGKGVNLNKCWLRGLKI